MKRRVQGHGISLWEVNDHSQGRSLIARDFKKPPPLPKLWGQLPCVPGFQDALEVTGQAGVLHLLLRAQGWLLPLLYPQFMAI